MRSLAMVSGAQLVLGLVGLARALRERRAYDIGVLRGRPEAIGREQWVTGTSLSAPGLMLVLQALATAGLGTRRRRAATRILLVQGAIMSLGYPAEHDVRRAWRTREMPTTGLAAAAEVLAVTMVVLAARQSRTGR